MSAATRCILLFLVCAALASAVLPRKGHRIEQCVNRLRRALTIEKTMMNDVGCRRLLSTLGLPHFQTEEEQVYKEKRLLEGCCETRCTMSMLKAAACLL